MHIYFLISSGNSELHKHTCFPLIRLIEIFLYKKSVEIFHELKKKDVQHFIINESFKCFKI